MTGGHRCDKLLLVRRLVPFFIVLLPALAGADELQNALSGIKSRKTGERVEAARALGRLGGPEAVSALAAALRDKKDDVRLAAAAGLGMAGGPEAVSALEGALGDKEHEIRRTVVAALGAVGGNETAGALSRMLDDKDESVAVASVYALATAAGWESVPVLVKFLESRDRKPVRAAVVETLGALADRRALPSLLAALVGADEATRPLIQSAVQKIVAASPARVEGEKLSRRRERDKAEAEHRAKEEAARQEQEAQEAQSRVERQKQMGEHYRRATTLYMAGKFADAVAEWEQVLALDPTHKQSLEMIEKSRARMAGPADQPATR